MNNTENDLIFEKYTLSLLIEDIEPAFKSKIPNVINLLKQEVQTNPLMKDPEAFRRRADTLLLKIPGVPDSSKRKFVEHMFAAGFNKGEGGQNTPKADSINQMISYLNHSVGNYEQAGYMGSQLSRGIMHDPGWNKPPTPELLALHRGDIVKYKGPADKMLNSSDDYMIVRKEEHPQRNLTGQPIMDAEGKPKIKTTFFVKLYDGKKGDVVDPRELEKRIDNPNYLKHIGNNLQDQQKNYTRIGQSHKEMARDKSAAAERINQGKTQKDVNNNTRWLR